ncbi:MAG: hypothetical protein AB3N21_18285 [Ruegeria sp.]|uniref:hypothetical protein n=1 Tax=Ruegeria sp. TaxID=1879320 RepID=UPI00349E88A8
MRFVETNEIQTVYQLDPCLRTFAARYGLSWKTAKKVLEANGVNFSKQIEREYLSGSSLNKLSEKHGPKAETLSNWLGRSGVQLKRGNHRRGVDDEDLKRVFQATNSVRQAALRAGIHWSTAADRLKAAGKM